MQRLLCRLQRSIQCSPITASSLRQVGPTAAAAATELGDATDELAGLLALGNHSLAKGCDQDHLALIGRIRQTTQHHCSTITELISKALRSPLQPSAIHTEIFLV